MLKQELRRNPENLRLLLSHLPPFDVIKAGYLSYEFTFPVKSVFDCRGRPYFHNEIYIGRGGDPNNPLYHGNMIKPRDFHNVLAEEPDGHHLHPHARWRRSLGGVALPTHGARPRWQVARLPLPDGHAVPRLGRRLDRQRSAL